MIQLTLACQPVQLPVEQLLCTSDVNLTVNCPVAFVAVMVPGEVVPLYVPIKEDVVFGPSYIYK